ncbi:MAG: aspartate dehydrogenase [Roseobacter sp.]
MPRKIALIGYGAIAQAVCAALKPEDDVAIHQVLVRPDARAATQARLPLGIASISSLDAVTADTDLVLECAGHGAVRQFGSDCLTRGIDFGIVSVGALADSKTQDALTKVARNAGRKLIIVPGAIGGIDALAAASQVLDDVRYTACKPPMSWTGSPAEKTHALDRIDQPTVLFEGTARAAALSFPKNANVVATVALAGIGFEDTQVTLMADPAATGNSHHVQASGALCAFDYKNQGKALAANPKTSALTALSVLRSLKHRGSGLCI